MKKGWLLIWVVVFLQQCSYNQEEYYNYSVPVKQIIDSLHVDRDDIYISIDKSDYKLVLKTKQSILKEYPVVFGGNPVDDKRMEGDQCTPEGVFKVRDKYPHRSWSKFIWIDYPNDSSRIKFSKAKQEGTIPHNARIGGEIGIHGVPGSYDYAIDLKHNWTLGCISLKINDVDEIYEVIQIGTKVIIRK